MTPQSICLLEDYGFSSCQSAQNQHDKAQINAIILQQTNAGDDDVPFCRYLLFDQTGQNKTRANQQRTVRQLIADTTLQDEKQYDTNLLLINALQEQGRKIRGLDRRISAAEEYKHSILNQDPELKSVLVASRKADADRGLRRFSQYSNSKGNENVEDDNDDDIPLFQIYRAP